MKVDGTTVFSFSCKIFFFFFLGGGGVGGGHKCDCKCEKRGVQKSGFLQVRHARQEFL